MRWFMIGGALLMAVGTAGAETPEPATIRLQLSNQAKVPVDVLDESRQEVVRIFARAGFEVVWTDVPPRLTVRIILDALGYDRAASHVMGVAVPEKSGASVQVFFRQVGLFARPYHVNPAAMLGHVIAHEVGHVLLATHLHSATGLMKGEWDAAQMRDVARGELTFTDGQARKIRGAVNRPW